jgi:NADH:ubiquinone oxidoreductase subunit E
MREAFVQNREKLVEALDKMIEREDWRHHELMEIVNKKLEVSQESSQAFVGAFQSMAQAMAMLKQSLGNNPPC